MRMLRSALAVSSVLVLGLTRLLHLVHHHLVGTCPRRDHRC